LPAGDVLETSCHDTWPASGVSKWPLWDCHKCDHSLLAPRRGAPTQKPHWYSQTVLGYKRDKPLKEFQERQNMQNWWKINGNTQECWTLHQMKITTICCCTSHNGGMHHHNSPTFKPFLQWSNLANLMSLLGAYNSATSSIVVDATKQHVHDDTMNLRCMQFNERSRVLLLAL
jgi:hypothetical protein